MKKQFILVLISLLVTTKGISQEAFYDAINITNKCVIKTGDTNFFKFSTDPSCIKLLCIYLRNYLPAPYVNDTTLKETAILAAFSNNPFLGQQIKPLLSGLASSSTAGFASSLISSVGGLNVTNLVDGLAQFMVERAKEELSSAFFEKFKEQMKNDNYADLQILFPETYSLLMTIDEDIYKFNVYLGSMREAFKHDLANLYVNLGNVLNSEKYKPYFDKNPSLKAILTSSFYIINSLSKKMHPGDILSEFPLTDWEATKDKNITGSLKTLKLISTSLRSKSKDHYWIPADSIGQLFLDQNMVSFRIFLGLMYQKAIGIEFKDMSLQNLMKYLSNNISDLNSYKLFVEDFIDHASLIEEYLNQITETKKVDLTYTNYYRYYNSFLDMVEMIKKFDDLPNSHIMNNDSKKEFEKYLFIAKRAGDVYLNVNQTNYSSAIINLIPVLDTLLSKNFSPQISQLESISKFIIELNKKIVPGNTFPVKDVDALANLNFGLNNKDSLILTNYIKKLRGYKLNDGKIRSNLTKKELQLSCDSISACIDLSKRKLKTCSNTRQLILKYGTFMAEVATAKSSEEVKSIIEATVLPPGSSSIKTYSKFNIALNSYLGAFAGHEWTNGFPSKIIVNSFGVAAPIGVDFSWGLPKNKIVGAMSVFVSVINIGALASYRLQNDSIKSIPEITLANIIAPGINVVFGRLGNTPLALGIGYEYGPQLRKVTIEGIDKVANSSRITAFLCVDIPFFNIYTKARE
jgi:hypothetical protein